MRKSLLGGLSAALLFAPLTASAVGPIQQDAVSFQLVPTYSAAIVGLVPVASATDFLTITGAAGKTIMVSRISCSGQSTANGSTPVQLVRRSTANLTGTSTSPTVVPNDPSNVAGTAVVKAYTANPGTLGTLVGPVRAGNILTNVAATANSGAALVWTFGPEENQQPVLRGATQVLALNANAASFVAGATLNCDIEWTER